MPRASPRLTEDGRVVRARELREARRAQIHRAARRVFAERGYQAASIADIIDAARIARGTFYLHYESKRAIFGEILEGLIEELTSVLIRVDVDNGVPPLAQLLANVERLLDVLARNADVARILLTTHDEELRAKIVEFESHVLALIQSSLSYGVEVGMIRDGDVAVYAESVLGSVKEVVARHLLEGTVGARARKKLAKQLLDYTLYGVLVRD